MIVKLLSTAVVIFIAAGLGAYGLSVAIGLLDTLIDPAATKDPQYGMSFMVGVPIGGILGGTAGYVLMPPGKTKRKAGVIFSIAGGVDMILSLAMGFLSAGSRGLSSEEFFWTITSTWCLVPLIASSAMLARRIYLLTERKMGLAE